MKEVRDQRARHSGPNVEEWKSRRDRTSMKMYACICEKREVKSASEEGDYA